MPNIHECAELIDAMQTVIQMEDDFHEVCQRLPGLDELNELIEALRTVVKLADEMPEALPRCGPRNRPSQYTVGWVVSFGHGAVY
jgi:hypothetical protein